MFLPSCRPRCVTHAAHPEPRHGPAALARYRACEAAWTVGAPEMPHHYLCVLAVDPTAQKTGLGAALLREVFAIVDADPGLHGVWLDTENPPNVGFYEKQGFRVAAVRPLASVRIRGMWRERRAGERAGG